LNNSDQPSKAGASGRATVKVYAKNNPIKNMPKKYAYLPLVNAWNLFLYQSCLGDLFVFDSRLLLCSVFKGFAVLST